MTNSRLGVTSPIQDQTLVIYEQDLLKILSESMNFTRHARSKSLNMSNLFYNNGDTDSVFNGEDAMSQYSGI